MFVLINPLMNTYSNKMLVTDNKETIQIYEATVYLHRA